MWVIAPPTHQLQRQWLASWVVPLPSISCWECDWLVLLHYDQSTELITGNNEQNGHLPLVLFTQWSLTLLTSWEDVHSLRSLLVVEERTDSNECLKISAPTGDTKGIWALNCTWFTPSWNYILSLHISFFHTILLSCLRRTWWDGEKEDVKCFGLFWEDAQVQNK